MSRLRRYASSLSSGYLLLVGNVVSTLILLPLTLRYLGTEQFALWALVLQITTYLQLVDLGITSSLSRILIDYKDDLQGRSYGAAVGSGWRILFGQGLVIGLVGMVIGYWLPLLMKLPSTYWTDFRWLIAGQSAVLGFTFAGRIFPLVLQAHQRFDICNYSSLLGLAINLGVVWVCLAGGLGLWAMLVASAAGASCSVAASILAALKLQLLPRWSALRERDPAISREVVSYAADVFLLSVGNTLITASQLPVVTRALGLEAAAVWSIASKAFSLTQQVIFRIFDLSSSALAEMIVRKEHSHLRLRFRQIVELTAITATFGAVGAALCNQSFLSVWVEQKVSWPRLNDVALGFAVAIYAVTRTHIGFAGLTKQIGSMRWIYFLEGLAFVLIAVPATGRFGLLGLILSGAATNLIFSGLYGIRRTARYFGITSSEVGRWLGRTAFALILEAAVALVIAAFTHDLPDRVRLATEVVTFGVLGGAAAWFVGLPKVIRGELRRMVPQAGK